MTTNTTPTTDPTTVPATVRQPRKTAAERAAARQTEERNAARSMLCGAANSAVVWDYLPWVNGGSSPQALIDEMGQQARKVTAGDLSELELMLLSQATALQAMFTDLARLAKQQKQRDNLQAITTLSLKAAAGSRQAIVALAELRLPKTVLFTKQANVTSGPQQINNAVPAPGPSRAGESANRPNELLGMQHGERLDTGAQNARSGTDPQLATLGALDRAEVASG